jgi:hypothetical protein
MAPPSIFTLESLRQHALSKGGLCLSAIYLGGRDRYEWECHLGHKWQAIWYNVKNGSWCHECERLRRIEYISHVAGGGPIRKTLEDALALAKSLGFEFLSNEMHGVIRKYRWRCGKGHEWDAVYSSVQRGHGCPACAGQTPIALDEAKALAVSKGFVFLSPEMKGIFRKYDWRCSQGHEWRAIYNNVRTGNGCPHCARRAKKTTADGIALAKDRGFDLLSESVDGGTQKCRWRCQKGHEWEASLSKVQWGSGCPYCAGCVKKNLQDAHNLAKTRGFEFVSDDINGTQNLYRWRCQNGHIFASTYSNVQSGWGCVFCCGHKPSKPQLEIYEYVKFLLPGEEVLLSDRKAIGLLELDIYVPHLKSAIEYDGDYWHSLPGARERDTRKDVRCSEAGIRLLRVKELEYAMNPEQIRDRVSRFLNVGSHGLEE